MEGNHDAITNIISLASEHVDCVDASFKVMVADASRVDDNFPKVAPPDSTALFGKRKVMEESGPAATPSAQRPKIDVVPDSTSTPASLPHFTPNAMPVPMAKQPKPTSTVKKVVRNRGKVEPDYTGVDEASLRTVQMNRSGLVIVPGGIPVLRARAAAMCELAECVGYTFEKVVPKRRWACRNGVHRNNYLDSRSWC